MPTQHHRPHFVYLFLKIEPRTSVRGRRLPPRRANARRFCFHRLWRRQVM
jgi:hypothetical protein